MPIHPGPVCVVPVFQHIAAGDQKEVERLLSQGDQDRDTVQKMCHPLCFCDDCEKLVSG